MLTSDHKVILQELASYTTFLARALAPTAAPTFCELLFGCMLATDGFVTQALLTIDFQCVWSSYHHWISHGKWKWIHLARRLIHLVCSKAPPDEPITLGLDDWVIERFSVMRLLVVFTTNTVKSVTAHSISGGSAGSLWLSYSNGLQTRYSPPYRSSHFRHPLPATPVNSRLR